MKHNYKTTEMRNIIKNALTVALLCGLMVQAVPTVAETRLCNENSTWVYHDIESFTKIMYEMSFSGGKKAPNGKDYSVFKIKRSISNGRDGIKTWGPSDVQPDEEWLFRQDGDKVYMYNTRLGYLGNCPDDEILMYDFAAKTGDPLPGAQENEGVFKEMGWNLTVQCLNDTVLGGEKRRMYTVRYVTPTPNGDCYSYDADHIKIIEGLGTTVGWMASHFVIIRAGVDYDYSLTPGKPGYKSRLVAVYDNNGDFIYGDEESYNALLNRISGVCDIMANDDASEPVYYNLQGQRISAPEKGQPCIERRGGTSRKIIM